MATVDQFLEHLTESGLFSQQALRALNDRLEAMDGSEDARTLRDELIEAGHLTAYQAEAIYQGYPHRLIIGKNYVVEDLIGAGGMGMVFRAKHKLMKREVALKVLTSHAMNDEEAVARFYQEVEVASALEHPNIVQARDAGQSGDIHYLVMEYVRGNNLQEIVNREGPLPVGQAINCILQAARGLAHAHKQHVIHRDIKPANLLLNNEGLVKILDMGLARINNPLGELEGARQGLTLPGSIMGTVDFMAPEQAADTTKADARSDIYSLGCTLFYILSGRPAYEGSTAMVKLIAHRESPIPDLCEIRDDVSSELNVVFQKMVAKKPEDRHQSMLEVISALEPCRTESEDQTRETVTQYLSPEIRGILQGIQNTRTGKQSDTNIQTPSSARPPASAPRVPVATVGGIEKELWGDEEIGGEEEPAGPLRTVSLDVPITFPDETAEPAEEKAAQTPEDDDRAAEASQPSSASSSVAKRPRTQTGQTFLMLSAAVAAMAAGAAVLFLPATEMLLVLFALAAFMVLVMVFRPSSRKLVPAGPGPIQKPLRERPAPATPPAQNPAPVQPAEEGAYDHEHIDESEKTLDAKLIIHERDQEALQESFNADEDETPAARPPTSELSASTSRSITIRRLSESRPSEIPKWLVAPFDAETAAKRRKRWASFLGIPAEVVNSVGTRMVLIPTGEFLMGSPPAEEGHVPDEKQHPVRLTRPYFLATHPVTVGEFWKFANDTGYVTDAERDARGGYGFDSIKSKLEQSPKYSWRHPGFAQSEKHPVVNITWNDAHAFCQWLSKRERITYRLPTEAEWEFACRAGTESRYFCGDDPEQLVKYANLADGATRTKFPQWPAINASGGFPFTAPVESFLPNAFGLHDMHGNVWEWCADRYGKSYFQDSPLADPEGPAAGENRVLRGGSWMNAPLLTRSAKRLNQRPNQFFIANGFRLAATP